MLRLLFCFTLSVVCFSGLFANPFTDKTEILFMTDASVEDILLSANDGKPVLILCTMYDIADYSAMESEIMNDKVATAYIQKNFHSFKFDAFQDIDKTQFWNIKHFPTFLVVGKNGEVLDRLEGVVNSRQLVGELNGWHERGEKANPDFRGMAYGKRAASDVYYKDVENYGQYSLENAGEDGYGLRIGTYSTKKALAAELGKIVRVWKNQISVYSQYNESRTVYCIVLGDFEDYEDAANMQELIYEKHLIYSPIVPFNTLMSGFIESELPLKD
ncbi:MAG: SPOR domain-containing protein [Bacteroidia bacterium]|nr:SPOR domain-containing protein [Bacteroidia bacterium]